MKLVRKRTEVSQVPVSKSEVKTVTHGIHYMSAILNSQKVNTLWENCHHFPLAYQNLMKPVDLERGDPMLKQVVFFRLKGAEISDLH